jgi:PilX N-terminal
MRMEKINNKGEEGQALFVAMIFLLALTLLGFGLLTMSTLDMHAARNLRLSTEALAAAEEGMLIGASYLLSDGGSKCGETSIDFDSETNVGYDPLTERFHYFVEIIRIGEGEVPTGHEIKADASWHLYRASSVGYVNERSGNADRHLRRQVEAYFQCEGQTIK